MNANFTEELKVAEAAVRGAGSAVMALYGKDYLIEEKGKGNPVTAADLEANRKIREIVLSRYPDDGWLSEEDKDTAERLHAGRVWVVDPIDGTKEFIAGIPQFAVSLGLVVEGRAVLGIVYNPAEERLYSAAKGRGAMVNGRPIHVSSRGEVRGASLLVSRSEPRRKFEALAAVCRLEPIGSIAYRLARVAEGAGDGTLTFRSVHEWDVCGGVLIVEEAGGRVVDADGKRLVFNQQVTSLHGLIASNESLTGTLQGMVARALAERG